MPETWGCCLDGTDALFAAVRDVTSRAGRSRSTRKGRVNPESTILVGEVAMTTEHVSATLRVAALEATRFAELAAGRLPG